MVCHIEASREPGGAWVAQVPSLPGLQIYGLSQEEALATARNLTALFIEEDDQQKPSEQKILVFYPRSVPDSDYLEAQAA